MNARQAFHDSLCLLGALVLAWLFYLYARVMPTGALAAFWALFTLLVAAALFHRALVRRRAFLAVYLAAGSPLQGWLRGGLFVALRSLAGGGLLALVLMSSLARVDGPWQWLALLAAVPALVLMRAVLLRRFARHASPSFLPVLSWRVAALAIGLVLVAVFVLVGLYRAYPEFAGVSLERAIWHMIDQEHARSTPFQAVLEARAALDGLRLWLAQQLMPAPGESFLQLLGWLLVVAEEMLFIWSYLLMSHGALKGMGAYDRGWR